MCKIGIVIYHQCPTDSIVCFSLPIYYSTIYESVILLVTEHARTVYKMFPYAYRNIKCNILYIHSSEVLNTVQSIMNDENNKYEYLPHGIWYCNQHNNFIQDKCLTTADEKYLAGSQYFYSNFTKYILDSKICFNYFNVDRDIDLETTKYNEITKTIGSKYYIINAEQNKYNQDKIPSNIKHFNLDYSSETLFDMIMVIENAYEIHLVSTFWSLIIYYLQNKYGLFSKINIYFHSYVRHGRLEGLYHEHGTLSNWTFYRCPETCRENEHIISGIK